MENTEQAGLSVLLPRELRDDFRRRLSKEARKASPLITGWIRNFVETGDPSGGPETEAAA